MPTSLEIMSTAQPSDETVFFATNDRTFSDKAEAFSELLDEHLHNLAHVAWMAAVLDAVHVAKQTPQTKKEGGASRA